MKNRLEPSIAAVQQFLKTLDPGDEFFLIRFSDRPTVVTELTHDGDSILSSLSLVKAEGWTALNDAICLGLQRLKHAKNSRRALFVLSDGGDNNSRYSDAEVRSMVQEDQSLRFISWMRSNRRSVSRCSPVLVDTRMASPFNVDATTNLKNCISRGQSLIARLSWMRSTAAHI